MHEWPLVIFTLLLQGSVGLVLVSALFARWLRVEQTEELRFIALRSALVLACIMAGLGLLASVAHLGYPLNALNSLRHIGSSWLSREIAVASLYLGLLCLVTLRALLVRRISPLQLLFVGLVGLVDVYCMAAIYFHSSVTTWMHWHTYLVFYGAVLALGAALGAVAIALPVRRKISGELALRLLMSVLLLVAFSLLVRLIGQLDYLSWLSVTLLHEASVTFPLRPQQALIDTVGLRMMGWGLQMIGVGLMIAALWQGRRGVLTAMPGLLLAGCLCVILAELVARHIFFTLS